MVIKFFSNKCIKLCFSLFSNNGGNYLLPIIEKFHIHIPNWGYPIY
jgi:hypothetical protein